MYLSMIFLLRNRCSTCNFMYQSSGHENCTHDSLSEISELKEKTALLTEKPPSPRLFFSNTSNPRHRWSDLRAPLLLSGSFSCLSTAWHTHPPQSRARSCSAECPASSPRPARQPLHGPQGSATIPVHRRRTAPRTTATCFGRYGKPAVEQETELKWCRTVQITTGPVFLTDGDNNNFLPCKLHL